MALTTLEYPEMPTKSKIKVKKRPAYRQAVIGMVYDFDGTLSPNNMQEDTIFRAWGIDKQQFWKKADALVARGYERTLAYLSLLLHDPVFQRKPLKRKNLQRLAQYIEYFPGVHGFFKAVDGILSGIPEVREWGIRVEHYIVSSGMKEILEGSALIKNFKRVYACEYDYGPKGAVFPKLVINDTNKTQFLFRINKGRLEMNQDINDHMPEEERIIPFKNMIYIGDSVTDVPSMTVVNRYGGHAIAVFDPAREISEKVRRLVVDGRVSHFAAADFRKSSLLFKIIRRTLNKIIHGIAYDASAAMSLAWMSREPR